MVGGLFREYSGYFSHATEVWKQHVIGVTIEAFDEYRDSVCKTLQDTVAQDSSRPDGSVDGQAAVNRQEEMFGTVQSVLENAQHLTQQRIADTLAQTFNSPPPILHSPLSNQTIQANQPGESATSQAAVISEQNDSPLDVSIKSEVDSSSESECESDTDDDEEVQVKDEPNEEEENIILGLDENYNHTEEASSHKQTENMDNSGDHRENSNESAREQAESNEAMTIDEELVAEEANSEQDGPIIIEIQYVSPPSSSSNAEANGSSAGQQEVSINLNEDIASDDEVVNLDAEDDDDFGEDEHMDVNNYQHNLESNESDFDAQHESDREGAIIDEKTDGEDCDSSEQVDMNGVEDDEQEDSDEETNKDDDDYNEIEDEEASLGVAGPSTSAQERQGTRRVAKRQIGSGKASKRQRTGRDVETVPLRVITLKLKCTEPGCKKVVKSKASMNNHLLLKHQLQEYRCLVRRCHGKVTTSFTTQGQLNDHRDQVHGRTTEWTCKCTKKFNSYGDLSTHYWKYHELGHFACSRDGCTFKPTSTRIKVGNHQANHREAKYECPVDNCDRSFNKKSNFDDHLVTHSGERPFPCPQCDKSFRQKAHLTRHLRIHRNDKCFRCTWPQCTYSSTDASNVIYHIRTEHFKLPGTKKQQLAAGIVDDRDARDYLAKN